MPMIRVLNYGNLIDGFRDYVGRSANRGFNERGKELSVNNIIIVHYRKMCGRDGDAINWLPETH